MVGEPIRSPVKRDKVGQVASQMVDPTGTEDVMQISGQVSGLHIYPVKGGRGIALQRSEVALAGLAGDRCWLLVDAGGRFLSQRELPALALLETKTDADGLHLSFAGMPGEGEAGDGGERFVARPDGASRIAVRIWSDEVDAALADEADSAALSRWFGRSLRLVYFDDQARRIVSRDWVPHDAPVGFSDGFPLLLAFEDSLRELNRTIVTAGGEAVPMSRFRPNIVLSDTGAYAEDHWETVMIGDLVFDLVKPCTRCAVTTVDQQSGVPDGPEPIVSLSRTRMSADRRTPGVLFGWNAVPRQTGQLRVGDTVELVSSREAGWPIRKRTG